MELAQHIRAKVHIQRAWGDFMVQFFPVLFACVPGMGIRPSGLSDKRFYLQVSHQSKLLLLFFLRQFHVFSVGLKLACDVEYDPVILLRLLPNARIISLHHHARFSGFLLETSIYCEICILG